MPGLNRVHGPDVYEDDGDVNWAKVSASGASFAIIKISEGDRVDTRATSERVKAIRKAGLVPGAYVFLRPNGKPRRNGAAEFRYFLNHAKAIGLYDRHSIERDLRPVLDCEASGYDLKTMAGRYRTRVYIRQAARECYRLMGVRPIVYTGAFWWRDTIGNRFNLNSPLWLAAYQGSLTGFSLKPWKTVALWQYTDRKVVPGISKPADYSVFVGRTGSLSEFRTTLTI